MRITLSKGNYVALETRHSFVPDYGKQEDAMTADVVIEVDHAGLIALIRKAGRNKSKKTSDGPITLKLKNITKGA